ncbi:hypothetical protein AB4Y45_24000 [Paraburkholderia sp. EG287A]
MPILLEASQDLIDSAGYSKIRCSTTSARKKNGGAGYQTGTAEDTAFGA